MTTLSFYLVLLISNTYWSRRLLFWVTCYPFLIAAVVQSNTYWSRSLPIWVTWSPSWLMQLQISNTYWSRRRLSCRTTWPSSWFLWLCSYSSLTEVDVYRLKQHGLSRGFCGSSDIHHLLKYAFIVLSHTIFLLVSVVVLILKYMPRRLLLGFIDCVEIHHLMT